MNDRLDRLLRSGGAPIFNVLDACARHRQSAEFQPSPTSSSRWCLRHNGLIHSGPPVRPEFAQCALGFRHHDIHKFGEASPRPGALPDIHHDSRCDSPREHTGSPANSVGTSVEPMRKEAKVRLNVLDPRHSAYTVLGLSPACTAQEIETSRLHLTSFWREQGTADAETDAAKHAEQARERIEHCADVLSAPTRRLVSDLEHGFSSPLPRAILSRACAAIDLAASLAPPAVGPFSRSREHWLT